MSELCPSCGQPMPKTAILPLSERELVALSAWWWTGQYRAAAMLAGVKLQTLKNQLGHARIRNDVHSTQQLAAMYLGQIRSKDELLASHNKRQAEAREAA